MKRGPSRFCWQLTLDQATDGFDRVVRGNTGEVKRFGIGPLLASTAEPPGHEAHERPTASRSNGDRIPTRQVTAERW